MPDPVLLSRLSVLEDDLTALLKCMQILVDDFTAFGNKTKEKLTLKVSTQRAEIEKLRKNLNGIPGKLAWSGYAKLRAQSNQINHEFLEIAGGVAIRSREIDEKICWIAQEFFRGIPTYYPPALTILATREAYSPTLAPFMRVQFPARTIWSLPLTAYQFANLVIADLPGLHCWAEASVNWMPKNAESLPEPAEPAPSQSPSDKAKAEHARLRAEANACSRHTQLMADALAVYLTGPCYAGSAILLRLSPLSAAHDDESQAPEFERAYVVLETLRKLDSPGPHSYQSFIQWLENYWAKMLADAGEPVLPLEERRAELTKFVDALIDLFNTNFPARYPASPDPYSLDEGGWSVALQWASEWGKNLGAQSLEIPQGVSKSSKVRDALNAGWACRSYYPAANVVQIAAAVRALCDRIIELAPVQGNQAAMAATYGAPATRAEKPGS